MLRCLPLAFTAALFAVPASAEVIATGEGSFEISLDASAAAAPADVWKMLITPARWWSSQHSWSGDAANLYIDAQATGCFCEKLPKPEGAPAEQRMGSVEHMHVVFADPQQGLLRMTGGLGPLQAEPVNGVMTITVKPAKDGTTTIRLTYLVNGLMHAKADALAPLVDGVLSAQMASLAGRFPEAAKAQ